MQFAAGMQGDTMTVTMKVAICVFRQHVLQVARYGCMMFFA
jgi:hypothetical protein